MTVAFFPLFKVTVTLAVPTLFPVSFPVFTLTVTTEVFADFQFLIPSPFPKVTVGPAIVFFRGTIILLADNLMVALRLATTAVSFLPHTLQVLALLPAFRTVAAVTVLYAPKLCFPVAWIAVAVFFLPHTLHSSC